MKIECNKVTWYSILLAIVIYVGIFLLAFYLGQRYEAVQSAKSITNNQTAQNENIITSATFICSGDKLIQAVFFNDKVELTLSDGRSMLLVQGISASGARYANNDESFVFWNKGDTAFVQEGNNTTYENCVIEK